MLIGPNAPLVFDRGLRSSYFEHAYDFYKPVLSSEYPVVDGHLSNDCYLRALDNCFQSYRKKFQQSTGADFSTNTPDYALFHTPYAKLIQKSWARLYYLDFLNNKASKQFRDSALHQEALSSLDPVTSYSHRDLMKVLQDETKQSFAAKVAPSLLLTSELGNSYCGSLYCGLQSLIAHMHQQKEKDKRLLMFSYGSGLAASMFSLSVKGDVGSIAQRADIVRRLKQRKEVSPQEFEEILKRREEVHNVAPFEPTTKVDGMFPGTFYLRNIDDKYRRYYQQLS